MERDGLPDHVVIQCKHQGVDFVLDGINYFSNYKLERAIECEDLIRRSLPQKFNWNSKFDRTYVPLLKLIISSLFKKRGLIFKLKFCFIKIIILMKQLKKPTKRWAFI
jgi:hypothetical protein